MSKITNKFALKPGINSQGQNFDASPISYNYKFGVFKYDEKPPKHKTAANSVPEKMGM